MLLQVLCSISQTFWVLRHQPKNTVAVVTEELAYFASDVVMVDGQRLQLSVLMLLFRLVTNSAKATLLGDHRVEVSLCDFEFIETG